MVLLSYNLAKKKQCDTALLLNGTVVENGSDKPLTVKFAEDHKKKKDGKASQKNDKHYNKGSYSNQHTPHQGNTQSHFFYDSNNMVSSRSHEDGNVVTHTGGQAYTPTIHGFAYGRSVKYGVHLGNSSMQTFVANDWIRQNNQALLYEHVTIDQFPQHHRAAGTVYLNSPRNALNKHYTGSIALHVAALPSTADVALLHDLFAPYGRILSAEVFTDRSQVISSAVCSGRGVVQIEGLDAAHLALQALNGAILYEGSRPLIVTMTLNS